MRYILKDGYVDEISFENIIECKDETCVEYLGTVPSGYDSLLEWSDTANIRAYTIVDGNLVYDADKDTELQAIYEAESENNRYVTKQELNNAYFSEQEIEFMMSNAKDVGNILPTYTADGKIITIDDASSNPINSIKLATAETLTGTLKLIISGRNILKNTAVTTTSGGVTYTVNSDKSISISGTPTSDSELVIAGTNTSVVPLFVFKKDISYYLNSLPAGVTLKIYRYENDGLNQLYSGSGGEVITFSTDQIATYVTINVATDYILTESNETLLAEDGEEIALDGEGSINVNGTTVYLMLTVGNLSADYEKFKERITNISLEGSSFDATDTITVDKYGTVRLIKPDSTVMLDNIDIPYTFDLANTIYTIQDTELEVEYKKSGFDYVTKHGNGTLVLKNTADGYGSIRKLTIEDLTGGSSYTLTSDDEDISESYTIDLTDYSGSVDIVIENGKTSVYRGSTLLGTLSDIYVKTYSPKTYIEVTGESCYFECEYMLESDFSVYCTRVEKDASIQVLDDKIALEVSRASTAEGTLTSSITVEAGKISQIVDSVGNGRTVTPASIVSSINESGSSVKIRADHINIDGVTFPTIQNSSGSCMIDTLFESTGSSNDSIEYTADFMHKFNGVVVIQSDMPLQCLTVKNTDGDTVLSINDNVINIGTVDQNIYIGGVRYTGYAKFG